MNSVQITTETTALNTIASTDNESKTQGDLILALDARWAPALGKSVDGVLEIASILFDAKTMLQPVSYAGWLKKTAKLSEGTASKYRSIHECELLHNPEFKSLLVPDWTVLYQLSRITRSDTMSPAEKKAKFKDALAYIRKESPTGDDLSRKVNDLLGKESKPKETLKRTGKLVTNNQDIVNEVNRQTEQAKGEAQAAKAEVADLKLKLAAKESEPTSAEIAETQTMDFEDDSNVVVFEAFKESFKEVQQQMLVRKIKALLHAEGLANVEVTVRQKVAA